MFKVALLQMVSRGADVEANLRKGERFCREAAATGADLALFPEMWSHGYTLPPTAEGLAEDGPFVRHFQALARELGMAIAVTYLQKWPGAPRNAVSLIDRHGALRMTYAKVHTCDFGDEAALTPGDAFRVCTLDTVADGPVAVGAMICFDREFPESARVLMLKGAEVILTPNACGLEEHRLAQFRTRAFENMLGVAMCNYAARQNNGHSIAYDGMAFNRDETARDMLLMEAGEQEGIYFACFDIGQMRAYREREAMGDAYRKPRAYQGLTEVAASRPFIRPDARR